MMSNILLNILSLGLKPLYEKNMAFYKIVKAFREKLPRQQNQARELNQKELTNTPFSRDELQLFTIINTSNHRTSISESEIDIFYNRINEFDFRLVLFKNHYKKFVENLNRFSPEAENKNFDLVMIQRLLADNSVYPLKPEDVVLLKIKQKYYRIRKKLSFRN